jgi:hypothetical protein
MYALTSYILYPNPLQVTHGLKNFQLDFSHVLRLLQVSLFLQLNT